MATITAVEASERVRGLMHLLPEGGPKGRRGSRGRDEATGLPMTGPAELGARVDGCRDAAVLGHYADATTYRVVKVDGRHGYGLRVAGSGGGEFLVAKDPDRWGKRTPRWEAEHWASDLAFRADRVLHRLAEIQARRESDSALTRLLNA